MTDYQHAAELAERLRALCRQIERENLHTTRGIMLTAARRALAAWDRRNGPAPAQPSLL